MIGKGNDLNAKVKGRKQSGGGFEPLPKGEYDVIVDTIKPWKKLVKDSYVNTYDEDGELIRNENDKPVKEFVKNLEFYVADVTLKVLSGDFKNRLIFTSITTHPSASFITEGFLYALDRDEIAYADIQTECKGDALSVLVDIDIYEKKITDPDSGIEEIKEIPKNIVTRYIRPSHLLEDYDI